MNRGYRFAGAIVIATIALTTSTAQGGLLYKPVVTVLGDGVNTGSGLGVPTSIYLYNDTTQAKSPRLAPRPSPMAARNPRLVNSWIARSS